MCVCVCVCVCVCISIKNLDDRAVCEGFDFTSDESEAASNKKETSENQNMAKSLKINLIRMLIVQLIYVICTIFVLKFSHQQPYTTA